MTIYPISKLEGGVLFFISKELAKKFPRLNEIREAFDFYITLLPQPKQGAK
jgi:hypothetical protein